MTGNKLRFLILGLIRRHYCSSRRRKGWADVLFSRSPLSLNSEERSLKSRRFKTALAPVYANVSGVVYLKHQRQGG
jgi:hypothetical protein